ncbi:uncharacterized protein LOC113475596 [Ciona intestinalis]
MTSQTRHIHICGAHSTGKTTLIEFLQSYEDFVELGVGVQEEVARKVVVEGGITQKMLEDKNIFHELNVKIIETLFGKQQEVETKDLKLVLWDRGIMDALTYLLTYVGVVAYQDALKMDIVETMLRRWQDEARVLVLVIPPNQKFLKNDGVRMKTNDFMTLQKYHDVMITLMNQHNIRFVIIEAEDLNERASFVTRTIKQWMK